MKIIDFTFEMFKLAAQNMNAVIVDDVWEKAGRTGKTWRVYFTSKRSGEDYYLEFDNFDGSEFIFITVCLNETHSEGISKSQAVRLMATLAKENREDHTCEFRNCDDVFPQPEVEEVVPMTIAEDAQEVTPEVMTRGKELIELVKVVYTIHNELYEEADDKFPVDAMDVADDNLMGFSVIDKVAAAYSGYRNLHSESELADFCEYCGEELTEGQIEEVENVLDQIRQAILHINKCDREGVYRPMTFLNNQNEEEMNDQNATELLDFEKHLIECFTDKTVHEFFSCRSNDFVERVNSLIQSSWINLDDSTTKKYWNTAQKPKKFTKQFVTYWILNEVHKSSEEDFDEIQQFFESK